MTLAVESIRAFIDVLNIKYMILILLPNVPTQMSLMKRDLSIVKHLFCFSPSITRLHCRYLGRGTL